MPCVAYEENLLLDGCGDGLRGASNGSTHDHCGHSDGDTGDGDVDDDCGDSDGDLDCGETDDDIHTTLVSREREVKCGVHGGDSR